MSRPSCQAAAVVSSPGAKWRHHGMSHAGRLERRRRPGAPPQLPPGGLDRLERRRRADDLARRGAHARAPPRGHLRRGEPPVEREVALRSCARGRSARARSGGTSPRRETAAASDRRRHLARRPATRNPVRPWSIVSGRAPFGNADHRRAAGERLAGDERTRFRHQSTARAGSAPRSGGGACGRSRPGR